MAAVYKDTSSWPLEVEWFRKTIAMENRDCLKIRAARRLRSDNRRQIVE